MQQQVLMPWLAYGAETLLRVFIPPMKPSIAVTLSGIPEGRSARVSWLLPGDYRKDAMPCEMPNGSHRLELNWRSSSRLLDAVLVIEVWCPSAHATPPTVQVEALQPERLVAHLNRSRFSRRLLLDVPRICAGDPRRSTPAVEGEEQRR